MPEPDWVPAVSSDGSTEREGAEVTEITELWAEWKESGLDGDKATRLADQLSDVLFGVDELTQAYLVLRHPELVGNMVSQLHVHVIARRKDDPAWPGPVWGVGQAATRTEAGQRELVERLAAAFSRETR